jgi:hypothetical protein
MLVLLHDSLEALGEQAGFSGRSFGLQILIPHRYDPLAAHGREPAMLILPHLGLVVVKRPGLRTVALDCTGGSS